MLVNEKTRSEEAAAQDTAGQATAPLWRRLGLHAVPWAAAAGPLLALLALLVRLVNPDRAYEVHVDEVIYRTMAVGVQHGHLPAMPGEAPFFLHPPGYFVLLAGWRSVVWHSRGIFQELYVLRGLNILLGALTAWLLYALVRKVAGWRAGLAAAAVFTFDPFALRQNGRVFLETATLLWLVAGYLALLVLQERRGADRRLAVLSGLLLGLAVVTKDFAAVLVALPLGYAAVRDLSLPRRTLGLVAAVASVPYTIWLLIAFGTGHGQDFLISKTAGLLRALGLRQETGFHAEGPPVSQILRTTVHSYGLSYLIAGAGVVAGVALVRRRRHDLRLLGLLGLSTVGLLAYAVLFGTIEEQFLYFLLVPALVTVPVACVVYAPLLRRRGWSRRAVGALAATLLAIVLVGDSAQWLTVRATRDDGWIRAVAWLHRNVPAGSTLVVSGRGRDTVDGLVLTGYKVAEWHSPEARKVSRPRWVIIPSTLVEDDYVAMTPSDAAQIRASGTVVFRTRTPTLGELEIVRLDRWAAGARGVPIVVDGAEGGMGGGPP